jgi:hypothetical protein
MLGIGPVLLPDRDQSLHAQRVRQGHPVVDFSCAAAGLRGQAHLAEQASIFSPLTPTPS